MGAAERKDNGVGQEITLNSRAVFTPMPDDPMWPVKLHDQSVLEAAGKALPVLYEELSMPVEPATKDQVQRLFSRNPHRRLRPWVLHEEKDGTYSFYSDPYAIERSSDTRDLYAGIKYVFDINGRLVQKEHIEGDWSYDRGRSRYQEFFSYDESGYLIQKTTWGKTSPTTTDRFEYRSTSDGKKIPTKMTRTIQRGDSDQECKPMIVDLDNYKKWLEENPYGFKALSKDDLNPQELRMNDFTVHETRSGISFKHPEQLEHALVIYGDGTYLKGETALNHDEKEYMNSYGPDAAKLFSAFARHGNMYDFVHSRIMVEALEKWKEVQASATVDASDEIYFSFDYDGAGNFHKTGGNIQITKHGLELTLHAAYVGNKVEEDLATAVGKTRGIRSITIEIPVNQTDNEGYFLIDLEAVSNQLRLSLTKDQIRSYLDQAYGVDSPDSFTRRPRHIWQDDKGVAVDLNIERRDYDSDAPLDVFFRHDETSIWGPMPKNINGDDRKNSPKIIVSVEPSGDRFEEGTDLRAKAIAKSYTDKLK